MFKGIFLFLFFFLTFCVDQAAAAKRAFVFAVWQYPSADVDQNGVSRKRIGASFEDAASMARQLGNMGFKVSWRTGPENSTKDKIIEGWTRFVSEISAGDDVVVYYSGHGLTLGDKNYIVSNNYFVDGDQSLLIEWGALIGEINAKKPARVIWIIDSCRNPGDADKSFTFSKNGIPDYNNPYSNNAYFLATAFGHYSYAYDARSKEEEARKHSVNSLFTRLLLVQLRERPKASLFQIAEYIASSIQALQRPCVLDDADVARFCQIPVFLYNMRGVWCFSPCNNNILVSALYTNERETADVLRATKSAVAISQRNAVFLGKKSAGKCLDTSDDKHPFGCQMVADIVGGKSTDYFNKDLTAKTGVNIRLGAPILDGTGGAKYECIVSTLNEGDSVRIDGVVSLGYAGDTFYWGTVSAGTIRQCAKLKS